MKSYLFSVFFVLVFAFEALGMSQQQRIERNMVALLDAIMDRNIEDVREYLSRVGTYTRYKYKDGKYHVYHFNSDQGIPVLFNAVITGDIELVDLVLGNRANLNDTDEKGRTALMKAAAAAAAGRARIVEFIFIKESYKVIDYPFVSYIYIRFSRNHLKNAIRDNKIGTNIYR